VRASRVVFAIAIVLTLLPLQYAVVARLPLPGAGPDLLLVAIVAVALVRGPAGGLVLGFWAGLAADLAPPADHTMGRLALAYALAGYVAGLLADEAERSSFAPMAVMALAGVIAVGTFAGVGALLGDVRITGAELARNLPSSVLYDVLLTPFVVPLVGAVSRRLEPDPSRL
jgi:rod shape-determining protein MreD